MNFREAIHKGLNDSGSCIFSTINITGLDMVALGYNSKRYIAHGICPPSHLNGFSTHNITLFSVMCGFKVDSINTNGKFDVDLITVCKEDVSDTVFGLLADFNEKEKAIIQNLISKICASGSMLCVLKK